MAIRSKPATSAYRSNFDQIKWPKRPRRGRTVLERAKRGDVHRQSRARLIERTSPMDPRQMTPGMKKAIRVLGLAQSPREKDMFRSLLKSDSADQGVSPSELREAVREVRIRKGV